MDKGKIFLFQDGGLAEMSEQSYDAEETLQKYLAEHTSLLAGEQIDSNNPRNWILINREISVPDTEDSEGRWALDHLFIDQDGIPTLVEVKRSEDTRARRKVVAQMLDYAANSTRYWSVKEIKTTFKNTVEDADAELTSILDDDLTPEEFWDEVESNIQTGNIRMIFVADEIPDELTAIVEFLNEQMDPAEVLAVEVKQYAGEGQTALVPRVKGQTEAARRQKSSSTRKSWDEESFRGDAKEKLETSEAQAILELYSFAKEEADEVSFGRGKDASFMAYWDVFHSGKGLFIANTTGSVKFDQVSWVDSEEVEWSDSALDVLAESLSELSGFETSPSDLENGTKIPLETLSEENNLATFKQAIRKFIEAC